MHFVSQNPREEESFQPIYNSFGHYLEDHIAQAYQSEFIGMDGL